MILIFEGAEAQNGGAESTQIAELCYSVMSQRGPQKAEMISRAGGW